MTDKDSIPPRFRICRICGGSGVITTSEGDDETGWEPAWDECDCSIDARIESSDQKETDC